MSLTFLLTFALAFYLLVAAYSLWWRSCWGLLWCLWQRLNSRVASLSECQKSTCPSWDLGHFFSGSQNFTVSLRCGYVSCHFLWLYHRRRRGDFALSAHWKPYLSFLRKLALRFVVILPFAGNNMSLQVWWNSFSPHPRCFTRFDDNRKNSQGESSFRNRLLCRPTCQFLARGMDLLGNTYLGQWNQHTSAICHFSS